MSIKSLLEKMESLSEQTSKTQSKRLMENASPESSVEQTSKTRGLKFWMEQVETNSKEKSVVVEGSVKEIAGLIDDLKSGELDIYDVLSGRFKPASKEEQFFVNQLRKKYDLIAGEMGLHADDDFEKISDILINDIDSILSEDDQVTLSPAQTTAQVIKKGGNVIGQVSDPQLANVIKQGITTGKISLAQESAENDKEMISEASSLEHLLMTYPHEHKQCQEGWGMDENFYEALADHYHKEGRIPRKVWHGPLDELRSCVENCYLQDTSKLMGEDISADLGLAPGSFGQMDKKTQTDILTMPSPITTTPSTSTSTTTPTTTPTSTSTTPTTTSMPSTNEDEVDEEVVTIGNEAGDEQIDEIAPIVGALAGRAIAGAAGAGSIGRALGSMAGRAIASDSSDDSETLDEYILSGGTKDRHSGFNPNGKERIEPSMDNIPTMKRSGTSAGLSREEPGMRSSVSSMRPKYMEEGSEESPVAVAVSRRIMNQRHDLLAKYGPEKLIQAIENLANEVSIGADDEIGSSDVSGWVKQIERELSGNEIVKEYLTAPPNKGDKVSANGKPAVIVGQIPTQAGMAKYWAVRFDGKQYPGNTYDQVHANQISSAGVAEALDDRGNPKPVTTGHFADKKYTDKGLPKPYPKLKNISTGKVRHHPNDPDQSVTEAKPDFLDIDKDGNKKETMKKAAKDKNNARGAFEKQMGGSAKSLTKGLSIKESEVDEGIGKKIAHGIGKAVKKVAPNWVEKQVKADDEKQAKAKKAAVDKFTSIAQKDTKKIDEVFPGTTEYELRFGKPDSASAFDKKKISTGTVYSRRYQDEPEDDESDTIKKKGRGRPAGSGKALGARMTSGKSKLMREEEMSIANLKGNADSRARKDKITKLSPNRITNIDKSKVPAAIRKARGDEPLNYKDLRESDEQVMAWERALKAKLVEGITVTSTVETPQAPETVSVSATEQEAQLLKKLLQSAGLGDGSSDTSDTGVVAQGSEEETGNTYDGTGSPAVTVKSTDLTDAPDNATEQSDELEFSYGDNEKIHREVPVMAMPLGMAMSRNPEVDVEADPIEPATPEDVIDDLSKNADEKSSESSDSEHGTLLSLIKKMIGHGADVANVQETEKVEERKHDSDCECDQCAEKDGEKVTKDIEYDEKDEDDIHGEKREDEDERAEQSGKKVAKDIEYDTKVDEDVEMCNECGGEMNEGHECSRQSRDYRDERLNEWANSQGGKNDDEEFTTEIEYMTKLISGGLNNMKQDQTTLPSARVKTAGEISNPELSIAAQMRKLSGIN